MKIEPELFRERLSRVPPGSWSDAPKSIKASAASITAFRGVNTKLSEFSVPHMSFLDDHGRILIVIKNLLREPILNKVKNSQTKLPGVSVIKGLS
jgi:hypothetical protein